MYLASEIPALSATFVYNEIFQFEERICPVDKVSVHRPDSPANQEVFDRLGNQVFHLYGRSLGQRLQSLAKRVAKHPLKFARAALYLVADSFSLGVFSRTAFGAVYRFTYAAILAKEMERRNINHLHVHFAHVPGDIAMYASLMTGIPYSITGHANDIYERGWLLKQKVARSKFFATISEFNRRALIAKGCDGEKINIIRCGIDQSEFEYRSPRSVTNTKIRIGSLGRLVPKKGFQTLLEACAIMREESIDFALEIAGDGPLMDELQSQISRMKLQDHVTLMGSMPHNQVSSWMRSLDIFALACCEDENGDVDGIPVVLMEAMAVGLPVVTTEVSGLPELVVNGKTGLSGQPFDAKTIACRLNELVRDQSLRKRLAEKAAAHVDSEFTIQANVDKLGELIFSQ